MTVSPLRSLVLAASVVCAAGSAGCVSQVVFDRAMADAAKQKADVDAQLKDATTQLQALQQQLAAAEATTQDRDSKLSELSTSSHNLQAQLDEATAINQQLRGELERLGKDVDKILAERGTLSKALDDAKSRLDELRKAQAAAETRTQLFQDLGRRFQALVGAGQLRVESRGNRLVMNVKGDLLFDVGKSELRAAGKGVLMEIARAIETSPPGQSPRRFLVTANVDEEPPKSKQHPESSWDLTVSRAVTVVKFLVSLGVPGSSLAAAGAGSFDPLAPNDNAEARARNRRVEIALLSGSEEAAPAAAPGQAAK